MKRLALLCVGLATGWLLAQTPESAPKFRHVNAVAFADAARKSDPAAFSHPLAAGPFGSVAIVTPKDPVRAHYHAKHDETVVLIRGGGTLNIGGETRKMRWGDVVFVPKGTVHSFLPEVGDEVLVSCFAPTFDGKDRIYVDR